MKEQGEREGEDKKKEREREMRQVLVRAPCKDDGPGRGTPQRPAA